MTPTTPVHSPVALRQALTAVRAGAEPIDAARAFQVNLSALREIEAEANAGLAVFAAGVIRQAMGGNPHLAMELLDRQAARNELARLKELTG
jgi:Tfp pilus assembly protein PilX